MTLGLTASDYVALVAAGIGAFAGSGLAFLGDSWRRRRERADAQYSALIEAQFVLATQLNTAVIIQQQYLAEHRHREDRFMLLVPMQIGVSGIAVDFSAIGFVAVRDRVDVLQKVHQAQESYATMLHVIETHNRLREDLYATGTPVSELDWDTGGQQVSVDARKARVIKGITDGLFQAVDATADLTSDALVNLGQACKRLYPRRSVLAAARPETPR